MQEFYERHSTYGVAPADSMELRALATARIRLSESLKLIQAQNPQNVLDVGCGNGFFTERIQETTGCQAWGIDMSFKATEEARSRGLQAKQCDVNSNISFDAETFDLVFCGEVIEHVLDPDLLLEEVWRVLTPGGSLILSTPNLAAWYNRILLLFGIQPIFTETSTRQTIGRRFSILGQGAQPVGHLRIFTLGALKDILQAHRFAVRQIKALPFLPFPILRQLDGLIGLVPSLGSDLLILAVKELQASEGQS